MTDFASLPIHLRLLLFAAVVLLAHVLVIALRRLSSTFLQSQSSRRRYRKLRSLATLITSCLVFSLYFFALGFVLNELGVSLTAYLASASVLGLAIGFGSQGAVQDVVTGITFIFSDLVDVGDLVEISGQTGVVKGITMRFIELQNAIGASVFIPNRTITNVINYHRGYVRCLVDVSLPGDAAAKEGAERTALSLMRAMYEQFPGIHIAEPSSEGRLRLSSGKEALRLKFRIWPNRGQPIETVFVKELSSLLKQYDPDFDTWMIAVSYEVEKQGAAAQERMNWPWMRRPVR